VFIFGQAIQVLVIWRRLTGLGGQIPRAAHHALELGRAGTAVQPAPQLRQAVVVGAVSLRQLGGDGGIGRFESSSIGLPRERSDVHAKAVRL
jgi:hypothetical protein